MSHFGVESALNNFELLCLLAATHNWCWNITCSTCGHYYFKNCLKLLIYNPSILKEAIILKSKNDVENKLYENFIQNDSFNLLEQKKLSAIIEKSSVLKISSFSKYPDWLGYIGLALLYTEENELNEKRLTVSFLKQFLEIFQVNKKRISYDIAKDILSQSDKVLKWQNLEIFENDLNIPIQKKQKNYYFNYQKSFLK